MIECANQQLNSPTTRETPNASIFGLTESGKFDVRGFEVIRGEVAAGSDVTALLEGQNIDFCQRSHWGFILDGTIHVRYTNGTKEVPEAGDVVYWPPGHAKYTEDEGVEFVLFSPSEEESDIRDQLRQKESELAAALPIWE